jgi:hypothetical protein
MSKRRTVIETHTGPVTIEEDAPEGADDREGGDPFEGDTRGFKCPACDAVIAFSGTYWECPACGATAEHPHPDKDSHDDGFVRGNSAPGCKPRSPIGYLGPHPAAATGSPATDRVVAGLAGEAPPRFDTDAAEASGFHESTPPRRTLPTLPEICNEVAALEDLIARAKRRIRGLKQVGSLIDKLDDRGLLPAVEPGGSA